MKIISQLFILIFCILFQFSIATSAVTVEPDLEFARSDSSIFAAIRFNIPEGYHAYAHKPGKSGLPTILKFNLEKSNPVPVYYPAGKPEKDIFNPRATVNVYKGKLLLLAVLPENALGKDYSFSVEMLLCSTKHCVPIKEIFNGTVPQNMPQLSVVSWGAEIQALYNHASSGEETVQLNKLEKNFDKFNSGAVRLDTSEDDFDFELSPQYPVNTMESYALWNAILLGLLAGLLLNVMPCVLPVLTIKVSGLLLMGNGDDKNRIRMFREHNIFFAAGVLTFFTFLAFLFGMMDLMWGQLYQNQMIILIMLILVFLMGLSLLGVFTLPALDLRLGENTRNQSLKSFITGLISTFLATPCSGPLLGGVLAWAFTQPIMVLLVVFWSVGVGMALPYLVFSIWPKMAKALPRPGNWMYVFEHFLGFMLLATALYLFSILPADRHIQILVVLLFVSLCAWLWGRFCGLNAPLLRRRVCGVIGVAAVAASLLWVVRPLPPLPDWQTFSPENFIANLGKKNMLVEFTADWCPNCKLLEATVLTDKDLHKWKKNYNLELIKVDLTRTDPYAQKLLEMLGSKSIPLTAIFARGPGATKPLVLRDMYGKKTLDSALSVVLAGT